MQQIAALLRSRLLCQFVSLAIIVCFASAARAQSALDGFDPNANGTVRVVVVQPDGKILIGGEFTSLAPNGGVSVTRNGIARLNPDGTLDAGFNPNADGWVLAMAVQADGKIVVGGNFLNIGGQPHNGIARLDAVSGLADSFNPNSNAPISSIALQADSKILTAGGFSTIGGQTRSGFARLDAATGLADSFDPNVSGGIFSAVYSIAVQVDGKILAGGDFGVIGGQTRNNIARLDPATGLSDSFNPNANFIVNSLAVQADGKVLAGGSFGNIGGQARVGLARLDAVTGAADSFNPTANDSVRSILVQPNGKILAGGDFTNIGGQTRNFIARLDPTTGLADAFDPNANGNVLAITVQPDGKIMTVGAFTSLTPSGAAAVTLNRIARLETDGRADRTLDSQVQFVGGFVGAIATQPDGKILIGGSFSFVLGVTRQNIARLNTDGTLDTAFNPNATNPVYSIVVQTDGKILVGGNFHGIGGQTRNHIARLNPDGTADSFDPNANGDVYSIAVQADGKILVGGQFFGANGIGGQTRNGIARLDATTGLADSFNPNANNILRAIAVQPDGKILVGGYFNGANSIGGQTRNYIARLDATTGLADSFDPNANNTVFSIAMQTDGKILAGGDFNGSNSIGGQTRNYIARLDATTGLADSFDPNATGVVYTIAVQADGKIIAGGEFNGANSIGGQTRNRIARLNAVTSLADSFDPNANNTVLSIAVQADGKVLVGGLFGGASSIGGQTRSLLARLNNDTIAVQNLAVTQTTVAWTRGGSSPQFTRVTFEDSTDGVNYNFLGNGTATGSNWTLTGLNLSTHQNLYIRARGYYRTGWYNGSESIRESVRNAFLSPAPAITGTVTYGNAAVPPKYISNATVTGTGSPIVFTTTAAPGGTAGQYALTGFGAGSYTVSLSKTTGQNSITSNDAARVAQHVAAISVLTTNNQKVTADVSGNGAISSQDAAKIAQYVASLPVSPPNLTGIWRFFVPPGPTFPVGSSPTSRTYSSVTSNLAGEDYVGLLMGEVTGNWTPSAARPSGGGAAMPPYLRRSSASPVSSTQASVATPPAAEPWASAGPERGIDVELPQMAASIDKEIVIPVSVRDIADKGVISYEFNLRYDPSVIQPQADPIDLKDSVSRGLSVVANSTVPGLLRVVVYGAMPIDGDGVLLNLRFTAIGKLGSVSPLMWERIMFNEGEPSTTTTDGQVYLQ